MEVNHIFIQLKNDSASSFLRDFLQETKVIRLASGIELRLEGGLLTLAIWKGSEWLNENQIDELNESLNKLKSLAARIVSANINTLVIS